MSAQFLTMLDTISTSRTFSTAIDAIKEKFNGEGSEHQVKHILSDFYSNFLKDTLGSCNTLLAEKIGPNCLNFICINNLHRSDFFSKNVKLFLQIFLQVERAPINPLTDARLLIEASKDGEVLLEMIQVDGTVTDRKLVNVLNQKNSLVDIFGVLFPRFFEHAITNASHSEAA